MGDVERALAGMTWLDSEAPQTASLWTTYAACVSAGVTIGQGVTAGVERGRCGGSHTGTAWTMMPA